MDAPVFGGCGFAPGVGLSIFFFGAGGVGFSSVFFSAPSAGAVSGDPSGLGLAAARFLMRFGVALGEGIGVGCGRLRRPKIRLHHERLGSSGVGAGVGETIASVTRACFLAAGVGVGVGDALSSVAAKETMTASVTKVSVNMENRTFFMAVCVAWQLVICHFFRRWQSSTSDAHEKLRCGHSRFRFAI